MPPATTTTPKIPSKSPTIRRILKEAQELSTSPSPFFLAAPLETDLFEWHFTLLGPPSSPFEGGLYHGRINLPPNYPLRPPNFRFLTPSGRFEVNREICLSISGHHEETWQPAWGIRTALVALRSFMETDVKGQLGGLEAGGEVRRRLAGESKGWVCGGGCPLGAGVGRKNEEVMGEHVKLCEEMGVGEGGEGEKVPGELKMGWRDEMGEGKGKGKEGEEESDGEETARLAEGFVQTTTGQGQGVMLPPLPQTELERVEREPTPHPEVGGRRQPTQYERVMGIQRRPPPPRRSWEEEGVPVWLDRLIIAVAVLLIAAVARVLLG
ncbi:putative ubiquitin-conjugating enzyme E2 J1 [Triangularia verruculosa]|uniref:Ubiquitin-conjugating enzyme E2 J1 n=1 Tax=Triangularia verruculosa TaxID=2587418 RepID=A0AAN6XRH0_9PEZI|nr:putative ubiquitin-conjugating enzyme E2 J1 [Triangularia verruculosa]